MSDIALTVRATLAAEYGDDWQRAISHLAEVVNSYRTDGDDVLVFTTGLVAANDVHGYDEPLAVSNYRVLSDDWQHSDALFTRTWSNVDSIGLRLDTVAPVGLVDTLHALDSYPVLSDDEYSRAESDMIDEHWQSYGRHDVLTAIADVLGVSVADLTDDAERLAHTLVWEGVVDYGYGGGYPSIIDVSAVDFGTTEVADWVRERVGQSVTLTTGHGYGDAVSFDLTASALVRGVA
jgi:hypothetical protein